MRDRLSGAVAAPRPLAPAAADDAGHGATALSEASANGAGPTIRPALPADVAVLEPLIAVSARLLGRGFYTDAETEAAITHVFGVDSVLVADGTYFVVELAGVVAGCGGWSARRTLFGGDNFAAREDAPLDPAVDAARVRAFFVAPAFARRGIGKLLLDHCHAAARVAGFSRVELMATLPGVPFYAANGYVADVPVAPVYGGVAVPFVPMHRSLLH